MAGDPLEIVSGSVEYGGELKHGLVVLGSYRYGGYRRICFAWYSSELSQWITASDDGTGFQSLSLENGTLKFSIRQPGFEPAYICIIDADDFPTI